MKRLSLLAGAVLLLALLAGCAGVQDPPAPTPSMAPVPEMTSSPSPSPEPTPDPMAGQEVDSTDQFLTPDQEEVFQRAREATYTLQGLGDNIVSFGFVQQSTDGSFVDQVEGEYYLFENTYEEYVQRMESIFTRNVLDDPRYSLDRKFIDYNGQLACYGGPGGCSMTMVEGYTRYVAEEYPDTYRLEYRDGEKVEFTLIAHYDANWDKGESMEVYTVEYPIRLVNTAQGWRVDQFHSAVYG